MEWAISDAVREFRSSQPGWRAWLETLPALVEKTVSEWDLRDLVQDLPSDMNILLRGTWGETGERVVVKFSPPDFENDASTASLRVPCGELVPLLRADLARGVQLLGWVDGRPVPDDMPGRELGVLVGAMVSRLRALPLHAEMIPLRRWCRELLEPPFSHPDWDELLDVNQKRCERLLATSPVDSWVHGDLHHGNLLLSDGGSAVAIDSKGVAGDPAFDVCTFVRNRIDLEVPDDVLRMRFSERILGFVDGSGLPADRCFGWAAAGNVLSEVWDAEGAGGAGFGERLRYVRILTELAEEAGG